MPGSEGNSTILIRRAGGTIIRQCEKNDFTGNSEGGRGRTTSDELLGAPITGDRYEASAPSVPKIRVVRCVGVHAFAYKGRPKGCTPAGGRTRKFSSDKALATPGPASFGGRHSFRHWVFRHSTTWPPVAPGGCTYPAHGPGPGCRARGPTGSGIVLGPGRYCPK